MKTIIYRVKEPVTLKFSLSMLYYDRAHPATVGDAEKIEQMLAEASSSLRLHASISIEIDLVTTNQGGPDCDLGIALAGLCFKPRNDLPTGSLGNLA